MNEKKDVENDILINAFYMISLFEKKKIEYYENDDTSEKGNESIDNNQNAIERPNNTIISNLKLQKLMYFVEAYYMVKYNKTEMFNTDWSAWDYGPVSKKLYNYFKKYGSIEISLTAKENDLIDNLPIENKKVMDKVFEIFGNFNAFDLVTLTHLPNSPWYKIKNSYKFEFDKLNDSIISKKSIKEWFEGTFGKIFKEEDNSE